MAIGGVRGSEAATFAGAQGTDAAQDRQVAGEAQVSRTPQTARPDPTRVNGFGPAAEPLRGKPSDYLTNRAEREAYAFITTKERPVGELLERFDSLSPASYNRILHALCLTRTKSGDMSALDKLVIRGGTEPGKAKVAERFLQQCSNKLTGQPGRILSHLAPETRARLETYAGWATLQRHLDDAK